MMGKNIYTCQIWFLLVVVILPLFALIVQSQVNLNIEATNTSMYDGWKRYPGSLAVDGNGDLYVATHGENGKYSHKLDSDLTSINSTETDYYGYWGIAILSDDNLVVTDCLKHGYNPPTGNNRVVKVNSSFIALATFGSSYGSDQSRLYNPDNLAVDRFDNIYVSTAGGAGNNPPRLVKLSSSLNYIMEYEPDYDGMHAIDVEGDFVYLASYDGLIKKLHLDLTDTGINGDIGLTVITGLHIISYAWTSSNRFPSAITFRAISLNVMRP